MNLTNKKAKNIPSEDFIEDIEEYNRKFVIDPAIIEKAGRKVKTFRDKDFRNVVVRPKLKPSLKNNLYRACFDNSHILGEDIYLSLNGNFTQRNSNIVAFGDDMCTIRYFIKPNLLQANSSYVVVDNQYGDLYSQFKEYLEEKGYIVKKLNLDDPNNSCRFNPFSHFFDEYNLNVILNYFISNNVIDLNEKTETYKYHLALKTNIQYLLETRKPGELTFLDLYVFMEKAISDSAVYSNSFEILGRNNPESVAYKNYCKFMDCPEKERYITLKTILTCLSLCLDNANFKKICCNYYDDTEISKFGLSSENGIPYKIAIFIQPDTSPNISIGQNINWLIPLLYNLSIRRVYFNGGHIIAYREANKSGIPTADFPVKFFINKIDLMGKNEAMELESFLRTNRRYGISICITVDSICGLESFADEKQRISIVANCDSMLFLGGTDKNTWEIAIRILKFSWFYRDWPAHLQEEFLKRVNSGELLGNNFVIIRDLKPLGKIKLFDWSMHPEFKHWKSLMEKDT